VEIVRLFRQSNEETMCEYLTVWNNPQPSDRILGVIEQVAREGHITIENGVRRAKACT
jgi:hypothetical protein